MSWLWWLGSLFFCVINPLTLSLSFHLFQSLYFSMPFLTNLKPKPNKNSQLPWLNIQLKLMPVVLAAITHLGMIVSQFSTIFSGGVGKNGSTVAVSFRYFSFLSAIHPFAHPPFHSTSSHFHLGAINAHLEQFLIFAVRNIRFVKLSLLLIHCPQCSPLPSFFNTICFILS